MPIDVNICVEKLSRRGKPIMTSKLEKVLELLINEEIEKAQELFHEVVVDKAREIHESLISEDEDMDELPEDMGSEVDAAHDDQASEEYYDEGDVGGESDEDDSEEEPVDGVEGEEGDEDLEEKFEDLEAKYEELQAKFDALEAKVDDDAGEEGDDSEGEEEEVVDMGDEDEHDEADESFNFGEDDDGDMNDMSDMDEDFEDITEGLEDFFHKVDKAQDREDGMGIGEHESDGFAGKIKQNKESPIHGQLDRNPMDATGKTLPSKQSEHVGFDMETPPKKTDWEESINNEKYVGRKVVKGKEQYKAPNDPASILDKDHSEGFGAVGTKSPISGKRM